MVAIHFSNGTPIWAFLRVIDDFGNEIELDMREQTVTALTAMVFWYDGEGK